eukprot:15113211-Ditylum_brightwellii.AAC.1
MTPKPPKMIHFHQQQQKHNNQLQGASTGTSRTPSSCHHCHHGSAALLSDTGATLLAPKPGNYLLYTACGWHTPCYA